MQSQLIITWGVPLVLMLGALLFVQPLLQRRLEKWRMEKRIASLGVGQLKNVLLDDGMGGQSFFERLLLAPEGILVLFSNYRDGIIFAGERMDTWAQVLGKRTIRFNNPLYDMEAQLATLRYHLPKVTVDGKALFMGDCSFPKGKPEGVWTLEDLGGAAESVASDQPVAPSYQQAWEEVVQRARDINPAKDSYLLPVYEGPSPLRGWMALMLVGAASVWVFWRLL